MTVDMKLKNRQNEPLVIDVRTVVTCRNTVPGRRTGELIGGGGRKS